MLRNWLRSTFDIVCIFFGWFRRVLIFAGSKPQKQVWFHIRLGKELIRQGRHTKAIKQFNVAVPLLERFLDNKPNNSTWHKQLTYAYDSLATSHYFLGEMLYHRDRFMNHAGIVKHLNIANLFLIKLLEDNPDNEEWLKSLARSYKYMGGALWSRNHAKAIEVYGASIPILEKLIDIYSDDSDWQSEWQNNLTRTYYGLAESHLSLGGDLSGKEDCYGAIEHYRAAIQFSYRAIDNHNDAIDNHNDNDDDDDDDYYYYSGPFYSDLISSLNCLGSELVKLEDYVGAVEKYKTAITLLQKLVDKYPDSVEWSGNLATSHHELGMALYRDGNFSEAIEQLRIAIPIWQKLVDVDSDNNDELGHRLSADSNDGLARTHYWLGYLLEIQKDFIRAIEQYKSAVALWEELIGSKFNNEFFLDDFAKFYFDDLDKSYNSLGDVLAIRKDYVGAMEQYKTAYAFWQKLLDKEPYNKKLRDFRIKTDQKISEMESKL